jgi:hypothetical protein
VQSLKNGCGGWEDRRTSSERPQSAAAGPDDATGLDYARRQYANIREWYDNADKKAQLILTANGSFVTILAGLALTKPADVRDTVHVFGVETWLFFGLSALSVLVAFLAAAAVLWSRVSREELGGRSGDPARVWYLRTAEESGQPSFQQQLRTMTPAQELDAISEEAIGLSRHVYVKHRYVDIGFFATTLALCTLLATAGSYVIRLAT